MNPSEPLTAQVDFSTGQHGWTAGFSDYPPADEAIYHLQSDYRAPPAPLAHLNGLSSSPASTVATTCSCIGRGR